MAHPPFRKKLPPPVIVIDRALLESAAFADLDATPIKVLMRFLGKRKIVKSGGSSKRAGVVTISNNGEIIYTYDEAKKHGIARSTFARAIDSLVSHGFIDISKQGSGMKGECSTYAISNRWEKWNTEEFVDAKRTKGRTSPWWSKKNTSTTNDTYPSIAGDTYDNPISTTNDTCLKGKLISLHK